ncbi:MAG: hypothetical protein NTX25_23730 [Proteobacteria bacterium]|nr:hypothetical protein [Pseudomonadota bacterium]
MNPSFKLEDPWAVLNAQDDKMCPAALVQEFMSATLGSTIEFLPELGHGFSDSRRWAPQYLALYKKLVMPVPVQHKDLSLLDLPLIEDIPSDSHADFFTLI